MGEISKDTRKIDELLQEELPQNEGDIVVGWVIAYEVVTSDGRAAAGFLQEQSNMTPWRSVGLLQWAHAAIMSTMGRSE
jgi:hypothetical protein